MESNRQLKAFTVLTLIFLFFFTVDWYSKINVVRAVTEEDNHYLSSDIARRTAKWFDSDKTYYWGRMVVKKEQNTIVPFITKETTVSESNYRFYSR